MAFDELINLRPLFELSCWSVGFWLLAVAVSSFWAWDSYRYDKRYGIPGAISDFLVSFIGWGALYLLLANLMIAGDGTLSVFLATIAILGIGGYGHKIAYKLTGSKWEDEAGGFSANRAVEYYKRKIAHEISSQELMAAIETCENVVVVDVRSSSAYQEEHILAATSLPCFTIDSKMIDLFDEDALFVVYGSDSDCSLATKGALKIAKLGFNTKVLVGGFVQWKRCGYETEASKPVPSSVQ